MVPAVDGRQHSAVLAALAAQVTTREQRVPITPMGRLASWLLELLLMVVTLGIGWVIWAIILSGGGQTPAKQLTKQRVVILGTSDPAGFCRMFFGRFLFGGFIANWLVTLTFGIILFMPFWDNQNRNIWDRMSNTQVIRA